jgi:2,4-dienoyl-CoA reductase (NADPH2)
VEQRTLNVLSRMLAAADVDVRLSTRITGVPGGYALLKHLLTGRSSALPVAGVVLAHPRRPAPHDGVLDALRAARGDAPTFVVGDALAPRRLTHAVLEGTRFGNSI